MGKSPARPVTRNAVFDNGSFTPFLLGVGLALTPLSAHAQTSTGSGDPPQAPETSAQPETVALAAAAPTLRFWDGSDLARHENGVVDGGSGIWSLTEPSWTDTSGTTNGPMRPVPAFAVFQGAPGTVTIDDSQGIPSVTGMQFLTDGYRLTGGKLRLDGGAYTSIRPGQGVTTRIDAEITGSSGLLFNDFGTLILTGANSYTGGTRVDAGTLIGDTRSIRGDLENAGTVIFDQAEDDTFTGGISGLASIWGFMVKRGQGTLTIGGGGLDWRIDEGRLVSPGVSLGGNIEIGAAGNLTLTSGGSPGDAVYRYALSGSGGFDVAGAGTLVLAASSTGFTGQARVTGTRLRVDGALGGSLAVGSLGVLSGTGQVGAVTVGTDGHLVGNGGSTLTLASLTLGSAANLDVTFAGTTAPALFAVTGDLTLDGKINIAGSLPLDPGIYRLLSYGGQLTDRGLVPGTLPEWQSADALSVQTAVPGQVNVVAQASDSPLRFWDGGDATRYGNGVVDGGDGTWRNGDPSWTGQGGTSNGPADPGAFLVFTSPGGQVTLDASNGALSAGGIQFASTGYRLSGDTLTLAGGGATVIRVGDGSQLSSGMTAEIAAPIAGDTALVKREAGTLILTGANSYSGGTRVEAGTLIGSAASIRGDILNTGTIVFDQAADGSFGGYIGGSGAMAKRGAGTLTLAGGTFAPWTIEQGGLTGFVRSDLQVGLAADIAIGSAGRLTITSDGTQSAGDYNGRLTGSGRFDVKDVALRLAGNSNNFFGETQLTNASLRVDNEFGGTVSVGAGSTLSGNGDVAGATIGAGGTLEGRGGTTLGFTRLTLDPGAIVAARFTTSDQPALFQVNVGPLVLDGTLDVGGSAPLGEGIYRLFSYDGQFTDNGLEIRALPPGQQAGTLSVQTATPGQVNVVSASGDRPLRFWDGGDATRYGNGLVDGGPGTWRSGAASWTGVDGTANGTAGAGDFAVFAGHGGQVLLDDADGAISTGGMQFAVSGYTLSGDTLTLGGGKRTVIRVGDGSAASAGMTAEIASRITGNSYLVKRDAGTLILSGDNDYIFGIQVEGGTLIGNARSIRGDLSNAGTVVFDQRENGTFKSGITALDGVAGTVVKRGSGDLTLNGPSSLDWTIEEGRVLTNAGRFTGDATLRSGGTIEFASAADTRYLGTLSGTGRLVKAGAGNLAWGTDSRGFTGDTLVRTGSLTVDGALGGRLTVAGGAALAGRGNLGSVRIDAGGRIAPGPSIGTLTIAGDLVIAPGARYEVEVDPTGTASDRIDVLGSATLAGTVAHIGANGTYRPNATYTILTAQRGIQGRFDAVTSTYAFLNPSLGYTSSAVTLTLQRNDVRFDSVAATPNQRATATVAEALAPGNTAYDAVVTADAPGARQAFDSLSGEFHASLRTALVEASSLSRDATLARLRSPAPDTPGITMWGQSLDSWSRRASDGNAARLDYASTGGLAGFEMQAPGGGFRIGMLAGHNHDELRGKGNAEIDSYHAGLYAGGTTGPLTLGGGLVFSWQDVAARRAVAFSGFAEGLRATYRARTAQAFAEAAYRLDMGPATIEPFANVAHVRLDMGGGHEVGESAALAFDGDSMRTTFTTTGLRGETGFALGGRKLTLRMSAGWRHAFGDRLPIVDASLAGQRFSVAGLPIARDSMVGELGLNGEISKSLRLDLTYGGALSSKAQDHRARIGLSWSF
ncbi:MAG: autotransporter domain-containing protein [Sphingomonas sp.]|uniref:autotransporter domain-containing protein n=1 Tax=Sphingomonas sp. TaxID=28214 RepID=UPI001B1B4895|nr:autotransporter domain-containing protein [Sphingomonas sp.]MBO9622323.1 autotransporter domain-containing protein [Sphingomonas sp.]